jgi:hypothetical protein
VATPKATYPALSAEQLEALVAFAREHGRTWRRILSAMWEQSEAPPALQALRNSHGPTWLHTRAGKVL